MGDRPTHFSFVGPDAMAMFNVCLVGVFGGYAAVSFFGLGCATSIASALGIAMLVPGFRNRITVTPDRVVVTRLWWFIPYRRQVGPPLARVWYSGDWGDPEGAMGVAVVCRGGREFHVGSPGTMYELHDALAALAPDATDYEQSKAVEQSGKPKAF